MAKQMDRIFSLFWFVAYISYPHEQRERGKVIVDVHVYSVFVYGPKIHLKHSL